MTLGELVAAYLDERTPERLAELRQVVRAAPNFDGALEGRREAVAAMRDGDPRRALELLNAMMPGAFLSPSVHHMLAAAHAALGEVNASRGEEVLAQVSLDSVLSTGDGTSDKPWSVLRVSDEYDVLGALGREPRKQEAFAGPEGSYRDRIELADGGEAWFTVDT